MTARPIPRKIVPVAHERIFNLFQTEMQYACMLAILRPMKTRPECEISLILLQYENLGFK